VRSWFTKYPTRKVPDDYLSGNWPIHDNTRHIDGIGHRKFPYRDFSLIIGGLVGEAIGLEEKFGTISDKVRKRLHLEESRIHRGPITAFLIFCVGL